MKNKILLLYLNTGGGHLAPAKAVANSLTKNFGETVEPVLINGFEETTKWVKLICEDGYRFAQSNAKWVFEMLYGINKIDFFAKSTLNLVSKHSKKYLLEVIMKEQPKKILIFHAFLIQPVSEIITELNLKISVFTMVTDPYSPSPVWFYNKDMHFIISNDEIGSNSLVKDIDKEKLHFFPFPLSEKFSNVIPYSERKALKRQHGFNEDKRLILIIGGADGIPKGKKIVKNVLKQNPDVQVAIVCGRNKKLLEKVTRYKAKNNVDRLTIYGYINFVFELLNISDIVITKGGTSTIMEILVSRKIPVISDYIWEQEKGNVDFVINKQVGIYEKKAKKIGKIVGKLANNGSEMMKIKENQSLMNLENGSDKISKFVYEYAEN